MTFGSLLQRGEGTQKGARSKERICFSPSEKKSYGGEEGPPSPNERRRTSNGKQQQKKKCGLSFYFDGEGVKGGRNRTGRDKGKRGERNKKVKGKGNARPICGLRGSGAKDSRKGKKGVVPWILAEGLIGHMWGEGLSQRNDHAERGNENGKK